MQQNIITRSPQAVHLHTYMGNECLSDKKGLENKAKTLELHFKNARTVKTCADLKLGW